MASADYFLHGDPEAGRTVVADVLQENGFTISPEPSGSWTVARGSAALTAFVGAWAGRKRQRLVYSVTFLDHQGTLVARFERSGGGGAMGGAIGLRRSDAVFGELSDAIAARLSSAGLLAQLVRG